MPQISLADIHPEDQHLVGQFVKKPAKSGLSPIGIPDPVRKGQNYLLASGAAERFNAANEAYRTKYGKSIPVVSAYRDPQRNKGVGGAPKSNHLHGGAIDIDRGAIAQAKPILEQFGFKQLGGTYKGRSEDNHFDFKGISAPVKAAKSQPVDLAAGPVTTLPNSEAADFKFDLALPIQADEYGNVYRHEYPDEVGQIREMLSKSSQEIDRINQQQADYARAPISIDEIDAEDRALGEQVLAAIHVGAHPSYTEPPKPQSRPEPVPEPSIFDRFRAGFSNAVTGYSDDAAARKATGLAGGAGNIAGQIVGQGLSSLAGGALGSVIPIIGTGIGAGAGLFSSGALYGQRSEAQRQRLAGEKPDESRQLLSGVVGGLSSLPFGGVGKSVVSTILKNAAIDSGINAAGDVAQQAIEQNTITPKLDVGRTALAAGIGGGGGGLAGIHTAKGAFVKGLRGGGRIGENSPIIQNGYYFGDRSQINPDLYANPTQATANPLELSQSFAQREDLAAPEIIRPQPQQPSSQQVQIFDAAGQPVSTVRQGLPTAIDLANERLAEPAPTPQIEIARSLPSEGRELASPEQALPILPESRDLAVRQDTSPSTELAPPAPKEIGPAEPFNGTEVIPPDVQPDPVLLAPGNAKAKDIVSNNLIDLPGQQRSKELSGLLLPENYKPRELSDGQQTPRLTTQDANVHTLESGAEVFRQGGNDERLNRLTSAIEKVRKDGGQNQLLNFKQADELIKAKQKAGIITAEQAQTQLDHLRNFIEAGRSRKTYDFDYNQLQRGRGHIARASGVEGASIRDGVSPFAIHLQQIKPETEILNLKKELGSIEAAAENLKERAAKYGLVPLAEPISNQTIYKRLVDDLGSVQAANKALRDQLVEVGETPTTKGKTPKANGMKLAAQVRNHPELRQRYIEPERAALDLARQMYASKDAKLEFSHIYLDAHNPRTGEGAKRSSGLLGDTPGNYRLDTIERSNVGGEDTFIPSEFKSQNVIADYFDSVKEISEADGLTKETKSAAMNILEKPELRGNDIKKFINALDDTQLAKFCKLFGLK